MGRKRGLSKWKGGGKSQLKLTQEVSSEDNLAVSVTSPESSEVECATAVSADTVSVTRPEEEVGNVVAEAITEGCSEVDPSTKANSSSESSTPTEQFPEISVSSLSFTGAIPRTTRPRRKKETSEEESLIDKLIGLSLSDDPEVVTGASAGVIGRGNEATCSPEIACTEQQQVERTYRANMSRGGTRGRSLTVEPPGFRTAVSSGSEESNSTLGSPSEESEIQSRLFVESEDVASDTAYWTKVHKIRCQGKRKIRDFTSTQSCTTNKVVTAWSHVRQISMNYFDLLENSVIIACANREQIMIIMSRPKLRLSEAKRSRVVLTLYCVTLAEDIALLQGALSDLERALGSAIAAVRSLRNHEEYTQTSSKRIASPTDSAVTTAPTNTGSHDEDKAADATAAEEASSTSGSGGATTLDTMEEQAVGIARVLVSLVQSYKEMIKVMLGHQHRMGVLLLYQKQGRLNDCARYLQLACDELLQHAHNISNSACPAAIQIVRNRRSPLPPLPPLQQETTSSRQPSLPSSASSSTSAASPHSSLPSPSSATSPATTLLTRQSLLTMFETSTPCSLTRSTSATLLPSQQEITPPRLDSSLPLPTHRTEMSSPHPTSPLSRNENQHSSSSTSRSVLLAGAAAPGEAKQPEEGGCPMGKRPPTWSVEAACRRRLREIKMSNRKKQHKEK